jgi:hypothetical protein
LPERPTARELLDVARDALVALLDDVEPRHHYTLRMAANAMAIAAREIVAPPLRGADDAALLAQVVALDAHDGDAQRRTYAALVATTRAKLAISNPKRLTEM